LFKPELSLDWQIWGPITGKHKA